MKRIELTISKLSFAALLLTAGLLATTGCKKNEIDGPGGPVADKITVTIDKVTAATTTATITGKVEIEADAPKDATYGVEYSLNSDFSEGTVTQQKVTLEKDGSFSLTVDRLYLASTYHYRTFVAKGKDKVEYGKAATFETGDVTVTVTEPTATETTATLKGRVSEQPEGVAFGLIYSTTEDPETDKERLTSAIEPAEDGSFTVSLEGLTAGQTYNYKTYTFQNELVYRYAAAASFSTNALPTADNITVDEVKPMKGAAGHVTFTGRANVSATSGATLAFEYSTTENFTTETTVTTPFTTSFSVDVINLKPSTTYYYRASLTLNGETTYTSVKSFTTEEVEFWIAVTGPYKKTETSATIRGSVAGYSSWDLTGLKFFLLYAATKEECSLENAQPKFTEFSMSGLPEATMTDLKPGTTYYCRTCVQRDGNYSYCDLRSNAIVSFTTAGSSWPAVPTVTEVNQANETQVRIKLSGSVPAGFTTGVEYGLAADFSDAKAIAAADSEAQITTGLVPSTTYHYRVYVSNGTEKKYGDAATFKTGDIPYSVTAAVSGTTATFSGSFGTTMWAANLYEFGILLSTSAEFDATTSGVIDVPAKIGTDFDMFFNTIFTLSATASDLAGGTRYYYRSYYKVNGQYAYYTDIQSFETEAAEVTAEFTSDDIAKITYDHSASKPLILEKSNTTLTIGGTKVSGGCKLSSTVHNTYLKISVPSGKAIKSIGISTFDNAAYTIKVKSQYAADNTDDHNILTYSKESTSSSDVIELTGAYSEVFVVTTATAKINGVTVVYK